MYDAINIECHTWQYR